MEHERPLGERYAVGRLLGRGGMAQVYLADDLKLHRRVAVKTLRPECAGDPSYRQRFLREARSAALLNSPGIVAVYDTGEQIVHGASLPYIVMEYVEGRTLAELAHGDPAPTPEQALRLTAGVLAALAHAHHCGIVHRDIKPANVMLGADGTVKVMDFGIARPLGAQGATLTQTAMVVGTAEYLSPEQARGEEVDTRTDLYSTGCLLYELLTGRPPFTGENPLAVAYSQVRDAAVPPSARVPGLPQACDEVVHRALAKDREERYQSAEEMRADIELALRRLASPATEAPPTLVSSPPTATAAIPNDEDTPAPAPSTARQPEKRDRRPARRLWSVAAAVGVLLAAGGAYAASGPDSAPGQARADTTVPVPDLVGKTLTQARTGAQTVGLHVVRGGSGTCAAHTARHAGAAAHYVCGQVPAFGTRMARGGSIRVQLSTGPGNP
ncbi:protein kinase domain-containing protein [Streptantibioticus ferralitis]|uniref:non-specific serine/threonine protein kinase n=1 Tax=Streptantibioticus ferralitis TaxID=236510 RepID=A0ABT5YYA7_9ACTN|nr:protein kinase [Streptantibioticus ferralitis]MDF2256581.1 protein kinase [Streptantibioticus ferralitis]